MFEQQGETMPVEKFADPADLADIICYLTRLFLCFEYTKII